MKFANDEVPLRITYAQEVIASECERYASAASWAEATRAARLATRALLGPPFPNGGIDSLLAIVTGLDLGTLALSANNHRVSAHIKYSDIGMGCTVPEWASPKIALEHVCVVLILSIHKLKKNGRLQKVKTTLS